MTPSELPRSLQGKKVLVTGATGFTGSVLLRKLCALGAEVRAIARPSSDCSAFDDLPVTWFRGEVYDEATANAAAADVHYIFHVAAAFRQAKIAQTEYEQVHVASTKLLAQAVAGRPDFERFVHVSTMGVHGHIENPPGDEQSPYAPGDIYQHTKLEAELWIREFAAAHKLPLTIIRPTAIYGPGDRRLLKVFKMALMPVFPILGRGKCLYHLIHVEDLTDAMLHAAVHPAALGEAFIVGSDEAIPLAEIARIIADEFKTKLRIVRLPTWPFFTAAAVCELIFPPLGIEPPLYRRRVAFYTKDRSFSTAKLRNVLGFTPSYSNERGIRETARWYAAHGWITPPNAAPTAVPRNDQPGDVRPAAGEGSGQR